MPGSWSPHLLPNLTDDVCVVTSPFDKNYNCIAYAAGDHANWWWPTPDDYWPPNVPRSVTFEAFIAAYQTKGYVECDDGELEPGYQKIAVFGKDLGAGLVPTHAAIQLVDGRWASKLGNCEDVEHTTLEAINGPSYGAPVRYLKRERP